ncbi:GLIPR2 [Branchiostoma lanceolatum]|uniref:GLIPR2 protein n=1 Tax=Branchiostoma lanceolatum TaxID=7740 RepID=A0A8K0F1S8_BRALA|nr:GLIPR2 [Branchiostoma lanceolatum]
MGCLSSKEKSGPWKTDFAKECLKTHNDFRSRHGAPPMVLNREACAHAQNWAEHLVKTGKFEHSQDRSGDMGENIANQWSSDANAEHSAGSFVQQWYDEVSKYDFGGNNFQPGAGHFSQVVWKASTELGVGMASDGKGAVTVVANYMPAGNVQGQFRDNVQAANQI